ncbi:oligosaccharide flippase family protein [Marinobacter sp.]|uniref:oligosaccharide flippase family protein n=1 Tax=Marinobacter sp. TaxID=50741 RepID=UPI002B26AAF6|nr:oligosaccharide flippase family protein [Marinobacter sp.]
MGRINFQTLNHLAGSFRANAFFRNVGWLTGSMLLSRVFRLAITVVVARTFSTVDYGQIALIFTAHEIITLFMQRCTQVKLVQAPLEALAALCKTTYSLNWLLGLGLLLAQWVTGFIIATVYDAPDLWLPIALLGLCHLLMPIGMVHAALNVRQSKLKLVAKIEVSQTFFEVVGVLLLIASGLGIWALVIPKLFAPLIWVFGHRSQCPWRFDRQQPGTDWRSILRYSGNLLVVDGMQVIRQNLDYLLVGHFLGLEALGLYFFAFNAGLGIATTFANAINSAFLPHLCNADSHDAASARAGRYRNGIRMIGIVVGGTVVAQAAAAPFYVPLVFGEKWEAAGSIPLIVILCLTALPKTMFESSSQFLRAVDQPKLDLQCHLKLTVLLVIGLILAVPFGLTAIALSILVTYTLGALLMLLTCRRVSQLPATIVMA